jgi:hypothetical protein
MEKWMEVEGQAEKGTMVSFKPTKERALKSSLYVRDLGVNPNSTKNIEV